ncbi:hypothetical protein ACP6PL_08115 [Dapis sp. BLCC M126]|uniref:hypothetical protein n=1 Tax=Dapis sp. BLCC M126 TaxID=3400189 RepID=UPI003CF207AC
MVLIAPQAKQSKLTYNFNQQLMSDQVSEKEATINKHRACQDEVIVASFLAELPVVLASLESISEKRDFRR